MERGGKKPSSSPASPSAFARFTRFPRSRFPCSRDHPEGLLAVYIFTSNLHYLLIWMYKFEKKIISKHLSTYFGFVTFKQELMCSQVQLMWRVKIKFEFRFCFCFLFFVVFFLQFFCLFVSGNIFIINFKNDVLFSRLHV